MTKNMEDRVLGEIKSMRNDMNAGFEQVDKRFNKVEKELSETNRLAQRANVLFEKLNSDVQQIAEGVIEVRMIAGKLDNHEDRLVDLEWRGDMHEKALKKVVNG